MMLQDVRWYNRTKKNTIDGKTRGLGLIAFQFCFYLGKFSHLNIVLKIDIAFNSNEILNV